MKKKIYSAFVIFAVYGFVAKIYAQKMQYDYEVILALVFAAAIALVNFGLSIYFNQKVLKKEAGTFTTTLMQGMLKRMVFVLVISFTIMLTIAVNDFVFVAAFFILYFLLQIIELGDLRKKNS